MAIAQASAASVAINLVVYVVARVAGADLLVPESPGSDVVERLGPAPVVAASVVPLLVAGAVVLVVRRFVSGRSSLVFTVLVTAALALSFVSFFTNDFSAGTATALVLMHVTVAAFALVFLGPVAARESR